MSVNQAGNRGVAILLLGVLFVAAGMPTLLTGQTVVDPPQFIWTYHPVTANNPEAYYSGVMEIGEETFVIGGETFTTRAYRQSGSNYTIPGPTMTMLPGNKYVLRFHNTLPYEPPNPDPNIFKDANISNLHTHGLHISGESPGDDVTRSFEGGFGGDFVYDIPADHMGGTYWYHAHHHGSTHLQVAGGAFGLLIVDDSADGIPANVAAMTERQLVFGFLDPGAAGTGGDTLMSGTLSPTWTVNGEVGGNINIPAGTWQHWRVLVADSDARQKLVEFGPECEVVLLARDGVWRTSAPKVLAGNAINLTGASRADFAVRVSGNSQIKIDGSAVASITLNGTPDPAAHPFASDGGMWSALRPGYLRDLRGVPNNNVTLDSISMGARTVNSEKFNVNVPTFTKLADSVQQWSLSGATNHPFHLHIYHVQALDSASDFEAGEYYDVIAANVDIRFDLSPATSSPFDGRAILHCHILSHEDRGAMGWMDVLGGTPPPAYPLDGDISAPYSEYYSLSPTPVAVFPEGSKLLDGEQTGGQFSNIFASDDQYLELDPSPTLNPLKQRIDFLLQATTPDDAPTSFGFRLESAMTGGLPGDVIQEIALFDYDAGEFELVDIRPAVNSDESLEVTPGGDVSRFVQSLSSEITARVTWRSESFSGTPFFWSIDVDEAVWLVLE